MYNGIGKSQDVCHVAKHRCLIGQYEVGRIEMRAGKVSESDAKTLEEICRLIDTRCRWFSGAVLQAVLVHKDHGEWANFFTKVSMVHKGKQAVAKRCLDYGSLAICELPLQVEEVTSMLKNLVEQGRLIIPELAEITFEGTFVYLFERNYLHSQHEQLAIERPANVFTFEADQGSRGHVRGGTLVAKSLPLYPDAFSAIENELQVDLRRYDSWQNKAVFLVPNYMARISHVGIGKSHISVRVEALEANFRNLIGKLYVEYPIRSQSIDFAFEGDVAEVFLRDKPSQIWLYLLDRVGADVLDYRRVRLSWGTPPSQEGITLNITLDDLREIIQQGENETVEFKLQARGTDHSGDEFVETVVAFANGLGGIILVGVDDDRNVAGVHNSSNAKKAIEGLIRHRCDPVPQYDIDIRKIDEKSVVLVTVFGGKHKPYLVRGKGPYIRVLSNDYTPLKYELDELMKESKSA